MILLSTILPTLIRLGFNRAELTFESAQAVVSASLLEYSDMDFADIRMRFGDSPVTISVWYRISDCALDEVVASMEIDDLHRLGPSADLSPREGETPIEYFNRFCLELGAFMREMVSSALPQ